MIVITGFSVIAGMILTLVYLVSGWIPKRTPFSIASCVLLSFALIQIQLAHLGHVQSGLAPLTQWSYLLAVMVAPALFFFFGRSLVQPDAKVTPTLALHLLPPCIAWWLPTPWNLVLMLIVGTGYALWLGWLVLSARGDYRHRQFERWFSACITVFALAVLASGTLAKDSPDLFYQVYATSIGCTYALILYTLVAIPDFVTDLFERTQHRYAVSTLGDIKVAEKLSELNALMVEDHLYREESLNLSSLARQLAISSHQLSELLNQHLHQSFSHYLRTHRLAEATQLLREAPDQSVLSIALQTGFRSQSTFYTAFREVYGCTPGSYRREQQAAVPS